MDDKKFLPQQEQQQPSSSIPPPPPTYTGLQQQQPNKGKGKKGYPGEHGTNNNITRDALIYDTYTGQPMLSAVTAQRQQIEQSLGPTCQQNSYHTLRMHYTTQSLLFSILIIPYCCGYRGRKVCQCTKCNQKFPNIILPQPI
ncbi:unnamed protein product [Cunninghamella blakesleeana]